MRRARERARTCQVKCCGRKIQSSFKRSRRSRLNTQSVPRNPDRPGIVNGGPQRPRAVPLIDAWNPARVTASTICSTVTCSGSNETTASFSRRLTLARFTPFSPSRAFLTAMGHAPHVMPSTARTTVEVDASAVFAISARTSSRLSIETRPVIACLPCCGRRDRRRRP